ncbi:heterokaryon incompatibility protein-domain-containing protein [Xylaria curta]|nr:heterokaryon incompatibility protein-domain-containing protein [Xylaria curta]
MLCEKCEKVLQATVTRWGTFTGLLYGRNPTPWELVECLSTSPLHFSLYSFYKSIVTGCYACRQLWATIIEHSNASVEGREISTAPFLSDPARDIPHSLGEFRREFSKHTNTNPGCLSHLLLENVVAKIIFPTIAWAIQTAFPRFISYDDFQHRRDFTWVLTAARVQKWCEQKSGIWLRFEPHRDYIQLYVSDIYTRLGLPTVHPSTCDDAATNASARCTKVSTAGTADLWRYWLNTCLTTHSYCRVAEHSLQPFVPKRLIQILQDDHGESTLWRLVCYPVSDATQYITLSHCWGSYQPICLNKKTIYKFSNPTSVSKLPTTYKHALAVAHELDIQYIWIDSLCILQDEDNKQDWEEQSELMGSIYSHAVCNIAATWASDGRDGLFSTNDPFGREVTRITLDWSSESTSYHQLWHEDSYHEDIIAAPLSQRGWVVQERYLSRRQVNFAKRQIYWECHELMASEQFPAGLPRLQGEMSFPGFPFQLSKPCLDGSDIRRTWADLVNLYSRCRLTKESDKLVAISGLAREVGSITKDICIQGLWKKDFYQQLCWRAMSVKGLGSTTTERRNAPTWSWANIDGPVKTARAYSDKNANAVPWIEVVEWPNPDDSTSRLGLRGIVLPHTSIETDHCRLKLNFQKGFDRYSAWNKVNLWVAWDECTASSPLVQQELSEIEFRTRYGSEFRFFMVLSHTSTGRHWSGIVLLPHSVKERKEYVRVGTFDGNVSLSYDMEALRGHLSDRLECHFSEIENNLDLNNSRLADLVKTVYII